MGAVTGDDWPDLEGALRTYLRADANLASLVGNRVFFGVPRGATEESYPLVMITRTGGGQAPGDAPLDLALIQFDCYGKLSDVAGGGRGPTTRVALAVRKALSTIRGRVELTPGVTVFDPRVVSMFYSPLGADDRPRYILTVQVPAIVTT